MRNVSLALVVLFAISGRPFAGESGGEDEVTGTLQAYESAWSRHDADAIASFYYEPAMRVGRGGPVVRPTRADQAAFFSGFMPGLARQGYANSTLEETNVRLLDERGECLRRGALFRVERAEDGAWTTHTVWEGKRRALKTKFTTAVEHHGYMYGLDDGILECLGIRDAARFGAGCGNRRHRDRYVLKAFLATLGGNRDFFHGGGFGGPRRLGPNGTCNESANCGKAQALAVMIFSHFGPFRSGHRAGHLDDTVRFRS